MSIIERIFLWKFSNLFSSSAYRYQLLFSLLPKVKPFRCTFSEELCLQASPTLFLKSQKSPPNPKKKKKRRPTTRANPFTFHQSLLIIFLCKGKAGKGIAIFFKEYFFSKGDGKIGKYIFQLCRHPKFFASSLPQRSCISTEYEFLCLELKKEATQSSLNNRNQWHCQEHKVFPQSGTKHIGDSKTYLLRLLNLNGLLNSIIIFSTDNRVLQSLRRTCFWNIKKYIQKTHAISAERCRPFDIHVLIIPFLV